MPKNTLIRCITQKQGKQPRTQHFTFASLTGEFVNRLFKVHHRLEAEEVCLDEKGEQSDVYTVLTPDELTLLIEYWPQLKQPESMPPEPEPLKKEVLKTVQNVGNDEKITEAFSGTDYDKWSIDELKELLDNNGIKYDKRIKKQEKLIELVKTNNL